MGSHFCFLRIQFPWLALLISILAISISYGFGHLSILFTSSALLLSVPILLYLSNTNSPINKNSKENSSEIQKVPSIPSRLDLDTDNNEASKQEPQSGEQKEERSHESSDAMSDSEVIDHTSSSDSETEWPFREEKINKDDTFSDGSISDEESLIEIALPTGHYLDPKKQQKWPDNCSAESILLRQNYVDIYEEDNLIEIDICMGSIKCSRFEIEA